MTTFFTAAATVVMLCNLLPILCHSKLASSAAFVVPSATQLYRAATNCRNTSCDRQTIVIGASKASQEPTTINKEIESQEAVTDVTKVDYEQSQNNNNNTNTNNSEISWKPPSQKTIGKIFKIQQPQDLLDFVIEDERLSVIKVYASWCKTCKVFDVRYRKLANQMGDLSTGNVRFAEMQYDNPANEEMCQLLNATQLPYILIYKGSQGKVTEFQCGPAKFQMLIDTVRGLLGESNDIMKDGNDLKTEVRDGVQTTGDKSSSGVVGANSTTSNSNISDEVNSLKDQLSTLENEKIEMFELMKSQIEVDKEEIQKLVNGVTIQKSIIEGKDDEIEKLSGVIKLKDGELAMLTEGMDQKVKEYTVLEEKVELYKRQVEELTTCLDKSDKTIATMQADIALHQKEAKEWERQMKEHESEWERHRLMYEEERSSVRKLLSVKSMGKKVKSFLAREK
jgi:thiol-disulfide isomerase/thioredoxin